MDVRLLLYAFSFVYLSHINETLACEAEAVHVKHVMKVCEECCSNRAEPGGHIQS